MGDGTARLTARQTERKDVGFYPRSERSLVCLSLVRSKAVASHVECALLGASNRSLPGPRAVAKRRERHSLERLAPEWHLAGPVG